MIMKNCQRFSLRVGRDAPLALSGEKHAHSLRHDKASRLRALSREKISFGRPCLGTEDGLVEFVCTVPRQGSMAQSTWHGTNCIVLSVVLHGDTLWECVCACVTSTVCKLNMFSLGVTTNKALIGTLGFSIQT